MNTENSNPILVIDDEPDIRELIEITLGRMSLTTVPAENVTQAKQLLSEQSFRLVLTDMKLPDGTGIDIVNYIQAHFPELPVAVITAFGSMDTAISALKAGAFDFVSKPVDLKRLRGLVDHALELREQQADDAQQSPFRILGESDAIMNLQARIKKLARSQAPVYICGESGSGKELVARMIHALGPRKEAPFIPVNCGAIPSELMESEFFGHKKGSFTGATNDKTGLFQAAHNGTLFLDEVADLPLHMQVKLLRAIQEKSIRPIGDQREQAVDIRILSATHKNLQQLVESGHFRQDLFYRINVIQLDVPPLRDRGNDIQILAQFFLSRLALDWDVDAPSLDASALAALQRYAFPGNVRELENILERALTLCDNNVIYEEHLQLPKDALANTSTDDTPTIEPPTAPPTAASSINTSHSTTIPIHSDNDSQENGLLVKLEDVGKLEDYLTTIEKQIILQALEATRWNRTAAAKKLGMTFRSLRYRLKKLGIEEEAS